MLHFFLLDAFWGMRVGTVPTVSDTRFCKDAMYLEKLRSPSFRIMSKCSKCIQSMENVN